MTKGEDIPCEALHMRNQLVDCLVKRGFIKSRKIEEAFRKVPREFFLPDHPLEEVYSNGSIITRQIGLEPISSSTAPSLMGSMLEILHLEKGMKVLEVGAGTGYNAAILTEILGPKGHVFSLDIDQEAVQEAQANLNRAGYKKVVVKRTDGARGLAEHAPYDRIIVTASVKNIPKPLIEQLKEGGIIVLPIWFNGTQLTPALEKRSDGTLAGLSTTLGGFMDLRSKTCQELLATSPEQGDTILISSEYPELFDPEGLKALLESAGKRKPLPSSRVLAPRGGHFFIFLALHEKRSVELFFGDEACDFGLGDSVAGIVDLKNNSACLFTRDNKLFCFGEDSAYEETLVLMKKWEAVGAPDVERLQVLAYAEDRVSELRTNDLLFEEKSPLLIVRVLNTEEKERG